MSSLQKLKAGPLRRGRGRSSDEARQTQDEALERDQLLRAAVLELCTAVETLEDADSGSSESSSPIHREAFGFDSSTTQSEVYAAFTSSVVELNVSGSPRAHNIWRAPIAGTVTAIYMVHESNTGAGITAQFYEPDGSTEVGAAVSSPPSTFTLGAGVGYQTSFAMSVTVTAGQLLCLGLDGVAAIGETNCWLEVTPS